MNNDMRISKFLYDFINNIPTEEWNKDKPNEDFRITVLDWLEKQGKKKSLNKVEQKDVELTDFESALFSAFSDAWQEYLSGKEVNVEKWAKEHSAELLEVVREQKPAWSEEDEKMIDLLIAIFRVNYPNEFYKTNPAHTPNMGGKHSLEIINWLKSLKERMKGE